MEKGGVGGRLGNSLQRLVDFGGVGTVLELCAVWKDRMCDTPVDVVDLAKMIDELVSTSLRNMELHPTITPVQEGKKAS